MRRVDRLFGIIQRLRTARRPTTAAQLAAELEVTPRTIYRDIASLQGMRVPIDGEAGVGYVMRAGFDLPPLMFSSEEMEAIVVGLDLLRRTGDVALRTASKGVFDKIAAVLPPDGPALASQWLFASGWGSPPPQGMELGMVRRAIRDEFKLRLSYTDGEGRRTERTVLPIALIYYVEVVVIVAWCELREAFRHFRADRITACATLDDGFAGRGEPMRAAWSAEQRGL